MLDEALQVDLGGGGPACIHTYIYIYMGRGVFSPALPALSFITVCVTNIMLYIPVYSMITSVMLCASNHGVAAKHVGKPLNQ